MKEATWWTSSEHRYSLQGGCNRSSWLIITIAGHVDGDAHRAVIDYGELLEPPLQLGPLVPQPGALSEYAVAVPDGAVEPIEQVAVGVPEVDDLRPELAHLLLLPHARPPRRLPVGHHPSLPPLLRELEPALPVAVGRLVGFRHVAHHRRAGTIKKRLATMLQAVCSRVWQH